MENVPGVPWANSPLFHYQVLIQYERKLVRKLRGRVPLHFPIRPLLKVHGNTLGAPWTNSLTFFIESLLQVDGNALGACWANGLNINDTANSIPNRQLTI